jgi:hypothetical protein
MFIWNMLKLSGKKVGCYGKCESWGYVPEILYFCVEFLKENFEVVIRELEMAWIKYGKKLIRKKSGNLIGNIVSG